MDKKKEIRLYEVMTNWWTDEVKEKQEHNAIFQLDQTCGAAPEQYDVYYKGEEVGYLRERNDVARADAPYGNTVWSGYGDCNFIEEGLVAIYQSMGIDDERWESI